MRHSFPSWMLLSNPKITEDIAKQIISADGNVTEGNGWHRLLAFASQHCDIHLMTWLVAFTGGNLRLICMASVRSGRIGSRGL